MVEEFKFKFPLVQIGELEVMFGLIGVESTRIIFVPAMDIQLFMVDVTVNVPPKNVEILLMEIF